MRLKSRSTYAKEHYCQSQKAELTFVEEPRQHHIAGCAKTAHFFIHQICHSDFFHLAAHGREEGITELAEGDSGAVDAQFLLPQVPHVQVDQHRGGVEGAVS